MSAAIIRAGVERLDALEPLWRALYDHHATLAPVAPMRPIDETWRRRRTEYERWLRGKAATLFVAEDADIVGYLMLRYDRAPTSWALGERIAEVETLSVFPSARGRGIGAALIAAARADALACSVTTLAVAAAASNLDALRFYEREGFAPFYLHMIATT